MEPQRIYRTNNSQNWCEKYRPFCFSDIIGQDSAVSELKLFMKNINLNNVKVIILHGPTGTGKTSLVQALAKELDYEIFELNASDLRNREQLEKILKPASEQQSFYKRGKILLIDEVDGISASDRGGLPELIELIETTQFPIIMTANNIWDRKFSLLRQKCKLIQLKEIKYDEIYFTLQKIAMKEQIRLTAPVLRSIAINAKGDLRAAINDLQSLKFVNIQQYKIIKPSERDKEESIFNALKKVFKELVNHETLRVYDSVDMDLNEIFLWVEENIPYEYNGKEIAEAYDALSIADVFRGRIYRQQYWRFLVYQNVLLSAGISSAKRKIRTGFTAYKRPTRILKIWLSNQKHGSKKTIAQKYAKLSHCSKKRALKEFPYLQIILNNHKNKDEIINKDLKLSEKEVKYLSAIS